MRLSDVYGAGRFGVSIEIFPPKSPEGDASLWDNLGRLAQYRPEFVSCTYGAGGSTRARTIELCAEIGKRFNLPATAHFTCLGGSMDEIRDWLASARQVGVSNIMALRGDPAQGQTEFRHIEGGFRHASELVALIHAEFPGFGIGVAGYPEKHPEAPSLEADLDRLADKVACGADAIFTQLFFDNQAYFRFVEACRNRGIRIPIVPGIMPVTNFAQIRRITSLCGAALPPELMARLEAAQDDKDAQAAIGTEFAIAQCRELRDAEAPGIHFYALNRSPATERILEALGIQPGT